MNHLEFCFTSMLNMVNSKHTFQLQNWDMIQMHLISNSTHSIKNQNNLHLCQIRPHLQITIIIMMINQEHITNILQLQFLILTFQKKNYSIKILNLRNIHPHMTLTLSFSIIDLMNHKVNL